MTPVVFTASQAGYQTQITLTRQSRDAMVQLTGGDVQH